MKNRKVGIGIIAAICCVLVVGGVGIYTYANTAERAKNQKLEQAGQIAGAGIADTAESTAAYVGEHIEISREELDRLAKSGALADGDEQAAREDAVRSIAVREVLCYRAEQAGLANHDEDYFQWLKEYRESIEGTSNYADFETYIKGTGLSTEEYWESLREDTAMRKEYYAELYAGQLKEDFQKENPDLSGEELENAWSTYFSEYKDQAVEDENLKAVE